MASPSMSTESARRAVEFARIPEMDSARNIATLIHRTTWSTRRWRSGTSSPTSQQSFTRPVYREGRTAATPGSSAEHPGPSRTPHSEHEDQRGAGEGDEELPASHA